MSVTRECLPAWSPGWGALLGGAPLDGGGCFFRAESCLVTRRPCDPGAGGSKLVAHDGSDRMTDRLLLQDIRT